MGYLWQIKNSTCVCEIVMSCKMDFLREEIENLKKLGQSWEMEKYQIQEAIERALTEEHHLNAQPAASKRGCCKTCLVLCGYMTVGVVLAGIAGVALYTHYSPFEVYVNRVAGDLQYPVMRKWRLLLLPLHNYFDMQHFSMRECLVDNPWYEPDEPDCDGCEEAKSVPRLSNISDFHSDFASLGNPIIVTDVSPYADKEYTVDEFFKYSHTFHQELSTDLCEVSSLDESVETIDDYHRLLRKLGPETPNIRWKLCYGEGLRAIRKFLPRPYFISTEGALEKFILIINSNEEVMPLPSGHYGNSWLAQVTGASEIQLKPIPDCNATCPEFRITLNKGEVLYLNQELWETDIVGNSSDELGILLLSTFA